MVLQRRKQRRSKRTKRTRARRAAGGGVLGGVVSALKTALPSMVLYEALRMHGKRSKTRKMAKKSRGKKSRRRR